MKKLSAILTIICIVALTVIPVSASEPVDLVFTAQADKVNPGENIVIDFTYTPSSQCVNGLNVTVSFDSTLIDSDKVKASGLTVGKYDGYMVITGENTDEEGWAGEISTLTLPTLETANGKATIYISSVKEIIDYDMENLEYTTTNATVTVQVGDGGSTPDPEPVFTVDKTVDGGVVKVEVKNADLAGAGKIYVATFNGGVLVDCIEKTIANGTLDFAGLEGDVSTAQMFVWNDQLVPITYATSAQ